MGIPNATMKHHDEYQMMRNLEVGDEVTDDIVEAYNTLIHGPRHLKHAGRPKEGDSVLFTRHTSWTSVDHWFKRSIPGYENHDDNTQTFDEDITAYAFFSPEAEDERDIKIELLEGGVGHVSMEFRCRSADSDHGRENDPVCIVVFGQ